MSKRSVKKEPAEEIVEKIEGLLERALNRRKPRPKQLKADNYVWRPRNFLSEIPKLERAHCSCPKAVCRRCEEEEGLAPIHGTLFVAYRIGIGAGCRWNPDSSARCFFHLFF